MIKKGKTKYLIITIICGYIFFFTSNIWLKQDTSNLVPATKINETISAGQTRDLTIYSWEYDKKKNQMLLGLCVANKEAIDTHKIEFNYQAQETSQRLKTKKLIETKDYIYLLLSNVPKDFKEVSVRVFENKKSDAPFIKIYTNKKIVEHKKISSKLTDKYLFKKYINTLIALTKSDIEDNLLEIEKENNTIKKLDKKLKVLDNEKTYQVGEELEKVNDQYSEIQNEQQSLRDSINDLLKQNEEYNNKILILKERIKTN